MDSVLRPVPYDGSEPPRERGDRAPSRARAKYALPTDRIKFERHPETLRIYSVASRNGVEPVDAATLGRFLNIGPNTANLNNRFFLETGLLKQESKGRYLPTEPVNEFRRKHSFDDANAAHVLAPLFSKTWFYNALGLRADLGPTTREDATRVLADEAGADDSFSGQIELLLEWLEFVGLIEWIDNTLIMKIGALETRRDPASAVAEAGVATAVGQVITPAGHAVQISTTPTPVQEDRQSPIALAISFDLKLTIDDLAELSPEQIAAAFAAAGTLAALKKRETV